MTAATLEPPAVPKNKKPPADEPVKPFHLKLPPEYRDALKAAWELTGRDMTVSGQIALEIYFQLLGVPFTPNWPAIVKELLDDGTS